MKTQLVLTIFIVYFGLVFVHPHDRNGYQSWKKELQTRVLESQNIFNDMKDELQRAQNTNIRRKKSFSEKLIKKREVNEPARRYDNAQTTTEAIIKSTTTLSPEDMVKEFNKLTDSKKEAALNELVGTCNAMLKRNHDKEHEEFFNYCSANYTSKLQFLEQSYMTQEYIDSHEDIGMVCEIMMEEKFQKVYLSANSSYQNLVHKYKNMTDAEKQKAERTAFDDAMRPMYHKSRQFKWELFVRWLLDTSFWSSEWETSVRLTQLHDTMTQVVNDQGLKAEDFIKNVLTNWDDGTRDTRKWPINDCKRAYKDFLLMRGIFETIMKLRTGRISKGDDPYGSVNENEMTLASRCADLLQNMLLTQSKIELVSDERSPTGGEDEERYYIDAVPDIVREWNDGKSKATGKKARGEQHITTRER